MIEWNIQPRSHACRSCGHAFQQDEPLHTLLFEVRSDLERLDVCDACWQGQHAQGSNHRRGFVSHWVSRYEPPAPPPPEPIRRENAESLLRKLVACNGAEHAASAFILAVMLERKRLLKVKAQREENGRRILWYEHVRTGELFALPDPQLRLDQLEVVQREVARLLEQGLPEPAARESTPAAALADEESTAVATPSLATSPTPSVSASEVPSA